MKKAMQDRYLWRQKVRGFAHMLRRRPKYFSSALGMGPSPMLGAGASLSLRRHAQDAEKVKLNKREQRVIGNLELTTIIAIGSAASSHQISRNNLGSLAQIRLGRKSNT